MSSSLNDLLEAVLCADRLRSVASDRITLRERKAKMSIDVTGVKWRATTIRIDRLGDLSGLSRGVWNQMSVTTSW